MNLSQKKRQRMLEFLERIRDEHKDDDETLIAINEIESELNSAIEMVEYASKGVVSKGVNAWKERWNTEYAESNVCKIKAPSIIPYRGRFIN